MWQNVLSGIGYATGIPVAQPKRTVKAIADIAAGKVEDWRMLIWGRYTIEQANKLSPEENLRKVLAAGMENMGKVDQTALDDALAKAEADNASPEKLKEIGEKDWTYDITSLRSDLSEAIKNLPEKLMSRQERLVVDLDVYLKQDAEYDRLSDAEQEAYLKDNPDFTVNRLFWGETVTIEDLDTVRALADKAEEFGIPLAMLPAFQLTEKGRERIPSDQELWDPYFEYLELPSGS
jgi:hypothetical protein